MLEAYLDAVRGAGGLPLLVPPGHADVERLLEVADGILLTGGDMDIHPSLYGAQVTGRLDRVEPQRTDLEIALARACLHHDVPVLGICGGMQVLAVAAGGTLVQDLPPPSDGAPDLIAHEQPGDPATPSHPVRVFGAGLNWFDAEIHVNSTHHQAVDDPGGLEIVGRAPDGVAEIVVHPHHPFCLGVQWHPELIGQSGPYMGLVSSASARRYRRQKGMSSSGPPPE
ncbi:MAG: gamma-glutamyl-gamma-aminobutyrate hydrolase family protein [Myxococcales bacterium]|nr:gamma-glutamyl-gamma-aminobutyrate hydrolase family protein [Myxococcales bacterium]